MNYFISFSYQDFHVIFIIDEYRYKQTSMKQIPELDRPNKKMVC